MTKRKSKVCEECGKHIEFDRKYCPDCEKKRAINMKFHRMKTKALAGVNINNIQRDVDFKQGQIDSEKIIETRVVKISDSGSPIIIDGYVNGVKPKHILQNEIDSLKAQQEMYRKQIQEIEKAEEEDEAAETGDKESTSD